MDKNFFKVREMSWSFILAQEKLTIKKKSQGNKTSFPRLSPKRLFGPNGKALGTRFRETMNCES